MDNKTIKLPEGFHDLGEEMKPIDLQIVKEEQESRVHYPSLWFHDAKGLKDLPKEGTAIIHYRKVMEREENVVENGKESHRYTVELQIHGIKPGEATESEEESNEPNDEDAIEKGLQAASSNS